jgi:hypothetical protein
MRPSPSLASTATTGGEARDRAEAMARDRKIIVNVVLWNDARIKRKGE